MNRKNIANVLKKKHDEFVTSIKDPTVKKLIEEQSIITGGAIASMLLNEEVNDYDYYFRTKEATQAIAEYFVKRFNDEHPDDKAKPEVVLEGERIKIKVQGQGVAIDEDGIATDDGEVLSQISSGKKQKKGSYLPVFITQNAITLSDQVQIIIRFYGEPEEIHKDYDFAHCTNYWASGDCQLNGRLVLNPAAIESLLTKELKYQGSSYPVCSIIRTRKFLSRGWSINAGQYVKMCFQVSELDLTNIETLEDQLTGVDASYFYQMIDFCKKMKNSDPNFEITTPYLISIIDRIFG